MLISLFIAVLGSFDGRIDMAMKTRETFGDDRCIHTIRLKVQVAYRYR